MKFKEGDKVIVSWRYELYGQYKTIDTRGTICSVLGNDYYTVNYINDDYGIPYSHNINDIRFDTQHYREKRFKKLLDERS